MSSIKQISVFVENKPGRLAEITSVLRENKVDIRAVSISDTRDFGILRLIVNKPDDAEKSLKDAGFTVSLTSVIAIGIDDRPGGLAEIMELFYQNNISVEYMYAFISKTDNRAYLILRVENDETVVNVLQENHIKVLTPEEITEM